MKRIATLYGLTLIGLWTPPSAFGFDFSVDIAGSPVGEAADVHEADGSAIKITAAELGLPASAEVDAFSFGTDNVEPLGNYNYVALSYSVDRSARGNGGVVSGQARTNGAAGDKFQVTYVGYRGLFFPILGPLLSSDAPTHNLRPLPEESDLDGLSKAGQSEFPVFFSVDAGGIPGQPWGPADVLVRRDTGGSGGSTEVFATAADINLLPGDDIDGLALSSFPSLAPPATLGPGVQVWVSLKEGSPTRALYGGESILLVYPTVEVVVDAPTLGLLASDELNALTAFDPGPDPVVDEWTDFVGNRNLYIAVPGSIQWTTWEEADIAAKAAGGELAVIESEAENLFVFDLVDYPEFWVNADCCSWGPWLGGLRVPVQPEPDAGEWEWVIGEPFEYTNWLEGEPNNDGGIEDRTHFFTVPGGERDSTWNDYPGIWELPGYVIEFPLEWEPADPIFVRGEVNGDGLGPNVTDASYIFNWLFLGGPAPLPTVRAADVNGDGAVDVADGSYLLNFLFLGGPPPPHPFPEPGHEAPDTP